LLDELDRDFLLEVVNVAQAIDEKAGDSGRRGRIVIPAWTRPPSRRPLAGQTAPLGGLLFYIVPVPVLGGT